MTTRIDQWTLNYSNFEGRWQGTGRWFSRNTQGDLDLQDPVAVIDPTTYDITFSDPDNGIWDGSGLFFAPAGRATYAISRQSYNAGGHCWQFPGAGGQSSLNLDPKRRRFGHEINLFRGRSRSMLVLMWELEDSHWLLQTIGAVGFRCRNDPNPEPHRPVVESPEVMLEPLQGWQGQAETVRPQPGVEARASAPVPVAFAPEQFLRYCCSATMADGLVFSVPELLPDQPFQLQIGGLLGPDFFQQISIHFDALAQLKAWEQRRFRP